MNKDVRIAKEILKVAKSLIADEAETTAGDGALDTTITVGSRKEADTGALDTTITVGSERVGGLVKDEQTKKRQWERSVEDHQKRENALDPRKILDQFIKEVNESMFSISGNIINCHNVTSQRQYVLGKINEYGEINLSASPSVTQDGKNAVVIITFSVYSSATRTREVFDTSKITLKPGTPSCKITCKSYAIQFEGSNKEELAKDALSQLTGIYKSVLKLKDKLYEMHTPWIKRIFGIGK